MSAKRSGTRERSGKVLNKFSQSTWIILRILSNSSNLHKVRNSRLRHIHQPALSVLWIFHFIVYIYMCMQYAVCSKCVFAAQCERRGNFVATDSFSYSFFLSLRLVLSHIPSGVCMYKYIYNNIRSHIFTRTIFFLTHFFYLHSFVSAPCCHYFLVAHFPLLAFCTRCLLTFAIIASLHDEADSLLLLLLICTIWQRCAHISVADINLLVQRRSTMSPQAE